jgi:hypothetical protein
LRWAIKRGRTQVVKLLLKDYRVDPSVRNQEALTEASKHGHIQIVRYLLTHPRVHFTKEVLQLINEAKGVSVAVFELLLTTTPERFWPEIVDNDMANTASYPLSKALDRMEIE